MYVYIYIRYIDTHLCTTGQRTGQLTEQFTDGAFLVRQRVLSVYVFTKTVPESNNASTLHYVGWDDLYVL